jgi:hypothetical protein
MNKRPSYRTLATICAATFFPAAVAVGGLAGGITKLINPDGIDVWQPLAYLGHSIVPSVVTFAILFVLALVFIVLIARQEKSLKISAKLPLIVLAINTLLVISILVGQTITKTAEDNWAQAHNGMTHAERDAQLDAFFKRLDTKK